MVAHQHAQLNPTTFVLVEQHHQKILVQHVMPDILLIVERIPELQFVGMVKELELKLVTIKIHLIATVALLLEQSSQIMFAQEEQLQAKMHALLALLGIVQTVGRILELLSVEMVKEQDLKLVMIKILQIVTVALLLEQSSQIIFEQEELPLLRIQLLP